MTDKTVLVVEDDLEVRDALSVLLEMKGYHVLLARSGEAALEVLDQKQPDVVLLDLVLPRLTGWDVLKQIRENYPHLGVIMLTGRSDSMDRVVGLELGADDYVVKPFDPAELLARIGALLRRTRRAVDEEPQEERVAVGSWDGGVPAGRRRRTG